MVERERKVIWSFSARSQLRALYDYIKENSIQNAENVSQEIFNATQKLISQPTSHPLDKYKLGNDGTFRAFILHRHMISYQITDTEIIILRLRHTSRDSLNH